ncbi:cupin domain-containing protein [Bacillus sp. FJAT-27445]|uniref:cupin domain-containing protein n=1 Tax=Bacillus sp. FJAT-27445 TaxID=1679166 RepID=UPI00074440A7|nr:cupin domain-containing protein [Bacillus sp. FJAT-27445]
MKYSDVKVIYLLENRFIPGQPSRPVLYYPGALKDATQGSEKELIDKWKNGVSGYCRTHRSSHEVLGVIQGSAALEIGRERKVHLEVKPGDLIVFPTGTEKRPVAVSSDFMAAGYTSEEDSEEDRFYSEIPFYNNQEAQYYQLSFNF